MSYFKGLTLTKKGEQLQAKVNGNLSETLVFTKAKLGSGSITNDNEIRFLTDLKASWGEAMVSNCEIQGQDKDTVAIELQFSNQNLREDKIFREIGLYARGNDGQEVLYAYANAGENYDYIPIMQNSPHTFVIVIYFKITSGTKISATIDLKSYVTQEKLNVELAKKAEEAIPIIDNTVVTNLNTVKGTKFFMVNGGSVTGIPTDSSFNNGDFNVAQFDSSEQRVQMIFNNYGVPFIRINDHSRNQEGYENAWGTWFKLWSGIDFNPDDKLNIADSWKNFFKPIGNESITTDLNNIIEPGEYSNAKNANKFTNSPVSNKAFTLSVSSIYANDTKYRTQILSTYITQEIYKRIKNDTNGWSDWWRVDGGDRLSLIGGTVDGNLKVTGSIETNGIVKNTRDDSSNWSVWKNIVKGGFWALEYHNDPTTPGNMRLNIYFNRGDTYDDSTVRFLRFPDISARDEYVAYQSWVNARITWENVSGKPSVFNPANHTHSWASLTGKPAFINVVDSTSTTDIATPRSVKLAYDHGSAALTEANKKLPLTGGTIKGPLTVQNKKLVVGDGNGLGGWSGTQYLTTDGYLEFEVPPTLSESGQDRCNIRLYYGGTEKYIRFPSVGAGQTIAYQEWVKENTSNKLKKVWEGKHVPTAQNNTTPFCTLPADWNVCFIAYEWFQDKFLNKSTFATAVITKDSVIMDRVLAENATAGSPSGSKAEALFYINSNNQVISLGNQASGQDCFALMVSYI